MAAAALVQSGTHTASSKAVYDCPPQGIFHFASVSMEPVLGPCWQALINVSRPSLPRRTKISFERTLASYRPGCRGGRGSTASNHGPWCDPQSMYARCQEGGFPCSGGCTLLGSDRSRMRFMLSG
jgi:hypothetical protein